MIAQIPNAFTFRPETDVPIAPTRYDELRVWGKGNRLDDGSMSICDVCSNLKCWVLVDRNVVRLQVDIVSGHRNHGLAG